MSELQVVFLSIIIGILVLIFLIFMLLEYSEAKQLERDLKLIKELKLDLRDYNNLDYIRKLLRK